METVRQENKERHKEFLEGIRKYQMDYRATGLSFWGWRLRRSLLEYMVHFIDHPRLEILDLGCNNGLTGRELCNALNGRNIETDIDGIDFVESALEIARTTYDYRSTFVSDITDTESLKNILGGRTYSLVHCCEVFHYVKPVDYKDFFGAVHSLLDPDGYFLLVFPNVRSILHRIVKTLMPAVFDISFKIDYDILDICSVFSESGFKIVSIYGTEILTNFKINLEKGNRIKGLFSYELAILAKKA